MDFCHVKVLIFFHILHVYQVRTLAVRYNLFLDLSISSGMALCQVVWTDLGVAAVKANLTKVQAKTIQNLNKHRTGKGHINISKGQASDNNDRNMPST